MNKFSFFQHIEIIVYNLYIEGSNLNRHKMIPRIIRPFDAKLNLGLKPKDLDSVEKISQSLIGSDFESFAKITCYIKKIKYWDERKKVFSVFWWSLIVFTFICVVYNVAFTININLLILVLLKIAMFLCIVVAISCIIILIIRYSKRQSKKNGIYKFKEIILLVLTTLNFKLSVEKILKYELAVCRDYARVTSAILMKLKIEHYLVLINSHTVIALKISNEYFIIDKEKPLKQIDKWLKKWNHDEAAIFLISKGEKDRSNVKYQEIENEHTLDENKLKCYVTKEEIALIKKELSDKLYIVQNNYKNRKPIKKITLEDAAYDYDPKIHEYMINYIYLEICSSKKAKRKIKRVTILKKKKDLIIQLY